MQGVGKCMQETAARLFGRAMEARLKRDGRPFVVAHLVTNRCMCSCKSCLWRNNDWKDVPLEELKRFYGEAREEGFVAAAMSGGEPFLRKDLGELVRFVKQECNLAIVLFTTGYFLKRRMDEVLPHIDMLIVSLDSARPERHNEIRGVVGLFERAIEGVRLARQKYPHLSVKLNCCIQQDVADDIDDLIDLAEGLEVKISFDVITEYRHGDGGSKFSETSVGMPLAELQTVCEGLIERKRCGAPIFNSELYFKYFANGKPGYKCHLPKLAMFVDGRGNLENCLNLDQPLANVGEMPLKQIMELPQFKQLRVDAEKCCSCNSPTMVDMSHAWENPQLIFESGGIALT